MVCYANTVKSTKEEIEILEELGDEFKQYSLMNDDDRNFLNSLILRKKPKKLLELGVCSAGSSLVMLNAIKNSSDAHLYSIDYYTRHYLMKDKLTGFYVDNYPELKKKWTLKTGGLALNFMDEIGKDIDFCLLDTVHRCPGEILDFLMVLPFLKKDAILVLHDINLHTKLSRINHNEWQITNNILMSAITGEKILPDAEIKNIFYFFNIGAIQLNENTIKHIWEIFNILTIRWAYMPSDDDIEKMINFIDKYYGSEYRKYFEKVVILQREIKSTVSNEKRN